MEHGPAMHAWGQLKLAGRATLGGNNKWPIHLVIELLAWPIRPQILATHPYTIVFMEYDVLAVTVSGDSLTL